MYLITIASDLQVLWLFAYIDSFIRPVVTSFIEQRKTLQVYMVTCITVLNCCFCIFYFTQHSETVLLKWIDYDKISNLCCQFLYCYFWYCHFLCYHFPSCPFLWCHSFSSLLSLIHAQLNCVDNQKCSSNFRLKVTLKRRKHKAKSSIILCKINFVLSVDKQII